MKIQIFLTIFLIHLMNLFNIIFQNVSSERLDTSKTETKIEIEVTYLYSQNSGKSNLFAETKSSHKIVQLTYNVPNLPKIINAEPRLNQRPTINNNPKNGFSFSTIDRATGAFTMPTSENEDTDTGLRFRNNLILFGKLIHVVSVSEQYKENGWNSTRLTWSHNACHDTVNSVPGNWIALVQSGTCSAERKLRNLMKLPNQPVSIIIYGSSQVIIKPGSFFSSNQDDSPMVMFLPWNNIQGVVRRCFNSSGETDHLSSRLMQKMNRSMPDWSFNSHNECNVTIKVYLTTDDNFLNRTSVLFVSISFILLMIFSLAWLMFYYVQRFRYIHTKEQFSKRLAHMAKKAVAKIPTKTIKQGDKETDAEVDNCAVCIEGYKPSDTVRILPCMHYFHKGCIDPWLLEQRSCPMCKLNILQAYGFLRAERGSVVSEEPLSDLGGSGTEMHLMPRPCVLTPCSLEGAVTPGRCPLTISVIPSQEDRRWSSLRMNRSTHRASGQTLDRAVSMRHFPGTVEERTSFIDRNDGDGSRSNGSIPSLAPATQSLCVQPPH